jgi:nicotinamidase-related amidase
MINKALVVIDMQNVFITDKNKSLPKKIRSHIEKHNYDYVIFTRFLNHVGSSFCKRLHWDLCLSKKDQAIVPELADLAEKNIVFEKKTYSIFKVKEFIKYIDENEIKKLYFCGVDLDACILASAFDAFDLDYDYEILFDLTKTSAHKTIEESAKRIIKRDLTS